MSNGNNGADNNNNNNNHKNNQEIEIKRAYAWRGVIGMLGAGVIMIWFISLHKVGIDGFGIPMTRFGCGVLIGGASLCAGGLLGFIFGIPSLNQNNKEIISIKYNDNLIKISEWLTTTIVGVGLTQLSKMPHKIMLLGDYLQPSFGDDRWGRNAALSIVFYFIILGFLCIYFWTRTDFTLIIKGTDDDVTGKTLDNMKKNIDEVAEKVSEITTKTDKQDKTVKIAKLENKKATFDKQKDKILTNESNEAFKEILAVAKPEPIKYFDDCQKGRWGGKPENGGYKLSATYTENKIYEGSYTVELTVTTTDPSLSLEGKVYFFLHDSFYPNAVVAVEASGNKASTSIDSYEASTVGAVCNGGNIKLELDLNLDPNCPDDYKYTDPLQTIDDINNELRNLKES